jgi:hypothetical protein
MATSGAQCRPESDVWGEQGELGACHEGIRLKLVRDEERVVHVGKTGQQLFDPIFVSR